MALPPPRSNRRRAATTSQLPCSPYPSAAIAAAPWRARSSDLPPAELAGLGIGPIKLRRSRFRPEGYSSNGCISCDAIQAWFPLHEDLMEFLAEGGTYEELSLAHWRVRATDLPEPPSCSRRAW